MKRKRRDIPRQTMRDRIAGENGGGSSAAKWFRLIVIIVIIGGAGYLGITYLQNKSASGTDDAAITDKPVLTKTAVEDSAAAENPAKKPEKEDARPAEPVVIQVQVLNGCGAPGVAREFTNYLRKKGFDVVDMGNYEHFNQKETVVIDRIGNLDLARRVAASLKCENVIQQIAKELYLHVTVVIGSDYKKVLSKLDTQ